MKTPKWLLGTFLLATGVIQSGPASAVNIGQADNFQNGTTQNWVVGLRGGVPPAPPANVPTGGPAGDGNNYLLLTSIAAPDPTPGNKLVVINLSQWTGNYLSPAVNFITMDVRNLGTTDLDLRLLVADPLAGISNTPTNIAVSTNALIVPAAGTWTRLAFPVSAAFFTALKGDAGAALSNVAELRLYNSPTPTFPGPIIDAQLGVDNITARVTLVPLTGISADFDGNGKTDIAVWRPSEGNWYITNSQTGTVTVRQWGAPTDLPVPGDYDGDGKTDIAVWRPSDGNWYIMNSQTGTVTVRQWGAPTDLPVPGDYDGDGKTDIAVWRPSDGNWYIINSQTGTVMVRQWGAPTDIPVPGDYDGDGKMDIAVWRPSDGNWYIINSQTGTVTVRQWGAPTDIPVPGDYDGDGKTDIAVWRPTVGNWYIMNSQTGTVMVRQWGVPTDIPVPGDYDGDGKTDMAVWRPSDGNWYIIPSAGGAPIVTQWGSGSLNDKPLSSNMTIR